MKRMASFAYGIACYGVFFITLLYAIGFLGNFGVPKSIDSGPEGSIQTALAVDAALLAIFALQRSIMARPWFKRVWKNVVPEPLERSTYVLFSSLALLFLFWQWRPIGGVVWKIDGGIAETLVVGCFAAGLLIVLLSTFLINHFDLFGLRQVYLYLTGREYTNLAFRTPFLYRYVRHPLYVGWLLTFWSAPLMTIAHLFFAAMTTVYILVAIQFEEADLVTVHGDSYRQYQKQVPMIIPAAAIKSDIGSGSPIVTHHYSENS
ncbi:MAG: isoprenylcysteine carboxylmethyltransferase family protein [Bryobacteraceae bacterium]|nr:isoprenylcysteine carboxylmethyltransferase family protein [Bryobacteraceae bacterium]